MFLHVGQEVVLNEKNIIGIFDLDGIYVSKDIMQFLSNEEKKGNVINVTMELPKSFIITDIDNKIYISQISVQTLKKRSSFIEEYKT